MTDSSTSSTARTPPAPASHPLYPPRITPPDDPLPVWRFLPTFLVNPLRTLPALVYQDGLFAPASLKGRVAWVTDPLLVEQVLLEAHETFPKSPVEVRIFKQILGDAILTAEGTAWRWQRRIVAPLFRPGEVSAFVPAMAEVAARMGATWRKDGASDHRRIDRDMTDATFAALAATIFAGATTAEETALKAHSSGYLEHTSWDVAFEMLRIPDWVWHPAKPAMRRHAAALRATMAGILERERGKGFPGGGLMAQLGRATDPETGAPMSDDLIASNLLTFAAAGHETTAKALTWTLYLLARAPDWQTRIADEVRAVAGSGPITAGHLDELVLTRQVLKESLRLYPPAPVMGRMAKSPIMLGGHRVETGTMIVIPIWAIHRHHKLWDEPDLFDPERFTPAREKAMRRTQYMPFGFGPRICVGMGFAMTEAITLLSTFVRDMQFGWDGRHVPEPVSRVTLRPKGGMPLRIAPR